MAQSFVRDTMVWGKPVTVAKLAASMIVVFPRKNAPAP
jgi:hypothetical protein